MICGQLLLLGEADENKDWKTNYSAGESGRTLDP
jgi:hypothetical protein